MLEARVNPLRRWSAALLFALCVATPAPAQDPADVDADASAPASERPDQPTTAPTTPSTTTDASASEALVGDDAKASSGEPASDDEDVLAEDVVPTAKEFPACPAGAICVNDSVLLAALIGTERALSSGGIDADERGARAIQALGALDDPRAVPRLIRLSKTKRHVRSRLAAITALGRFPMSNDAVARLTHVLSRGSGSKLGETALIALLGVSRLESCPEGAVCAPDEEVLTSLRNLERAIPGVGKKEKVLISLLVDLALIDDPRVVTRLLRISEVRRYPALRRAAIGALGEHTDDVRAVRRLSRTLAVDEPLEDAIPALGPLLRVAVNSDEPSPLPCESKDRCADDTSLLHALLELERAASPERPEALRDLGALRDARTLPHLWRYSYSKRTADRHAALEGLSLQAEDRRILKRLIDVLRGEPKDARIVLPGLVEVPGDAVTTALFETRAAAGDEQWREELETALKARAPERLAEVLSAEAAAAEAERLRLLEEEARGGVMVDYGKRGAVAAAAAAAGAYGGGAASSVVADQVEQGSGTLFGCYGCAVGLPSMAAIGWFSLGDAELTLPDVGLALSGFAWGAWAGGLVPYAVAGSEMNDARHVVYSAAAGQLIGLAAATTTAVFVDYEWSDIAEIHLLTATANTLTYGVLTSIATEGDIRVLPASLAVATVAGGVGASLASRFVEVRPRDVLHGAVATGVGLGVGLQIGLATQPFENAPTRAAGLTVAGASLGLLSAYTLAGFDASPGYGGSLYEAWAATTGSAAGLGVGVILDWAIDDATVPDGVFTPAMGATVGLGAALSTIAFPGGVEQDAADLLAHPLIVGFSLYHVTALLAAAEAEPRLTLASALLAPSIASAAAVFSAPFISASLGDVTMAASMMGAGAWFSSMLTWSIASRAPVPPWVWVAATATAMDIGFFGGVALNWVDWDRLGWKVTYVTSVAGATTLVLALPGTLVALGTGGIIQVPDVLLGSSLLGVALGLGTMAFIDFRIAPEIEILDEHIPIDIPDGVTVTPQVTALPPAPGLEGKDAGAMTFGVGVRY
jgi:hypothetical protein